MPSLMDTIYNECLHVDPYSKLRRGGSHANGFHISGSDLNVSWETSVEDALSRLQARGVFSMMPWRHGTRVEKRNAGSATITVNDTGMQFTAEMLSRYSWMAGVRVFVRTVKHWARDCCEGLSGHVATLLALHFCVQAWKVPCLESLQQQKDILQLRVETTPLQSFFDYFRQFDFETYAICCRGKNLVLRKYLAPPSSKSTKVYVRGPLVDDCSSFDLDSFLGALNAPWDIPEALGDHEKDGNDESLESDLQSLWCIHDLLVRQFVPTKPEGSRPISKSHHQSAARQRPQHFQRGQSPPPGSFPRTPSPTQHVPSAPAMSGTVNFPTGPVKAIVTPAFPALFAQQQSGPPRIISPRPVEDIQGSRATQQWKYSPYSPSTTPTTFQGTHESQTLDEWLSQPPKVDGNARGEKGRKGQKGQTIISPKWSPMVSPQGTAKGAMDRWSPQTQTRLRIAEVKLEKSLLLDLSLQAREADELGDRYKNAWLVKVATGDKDGFRTVRALPSKVLLTGVGAYSFTVVVKKTQSSFLNVGVCEWFAHENEADNTAPGTILEIPAAVASDAAQRNGENNPKGFLLGCRRGVRAFAAESGGWDTEAFLGSDILAGSIIEFQVRPEDGGLSLWVDPTEINLRKRRKWDWDKPYSASPWEKLFNLPNRRYVPVCTLFSGDDEVLLAF